MKHSHKTNPKHAVRAFGHTVILHSSTVVPAAVVIILVAVGGFTLIATHAATYATSAEAESGTISGNASTISDTNASGGSGVKFGVSAGGTTSGGCTSSGTVAPCIGSTTLPLRAGVHQASMMSLVIQLSIAQSGRQKAQRCPIIPRSTTAILRIPCQKAAAT